MEHVTFADIAERHGVARAINLLRTIERLAQIKNEILSMDCDTRFEKAFRTMCETPSETNFIDTGYTPPETQNAAQQSEE